VPLLYRSHAARSAHAIHPARRDPTDTRENPLDTVRVLHDTRPRHVRTHVVEGVNDRDITRLGINGSAGTMRVAGSAGTRCLRGEMADR